MKPRLTIALALLIMLPPRPGLMRAQASGTARNFQLVGHNPLSSRGMNAALAIFDHFVYIGNRTDGSSRCGVGDPRGTTTGLDSCPHVDPGILIIDVANPASPKAVGEIPVPLNPSGTPVGITTRELRVWPRKKLLIVLTFRCSSVIHACPPGNDTQFPFDLKFFTLEDPVHPQFIRSHVTRSSAGVAIKPHEFFLWIDPADDDRALLWESTPSVSANPARPNLAIEDISAVPEGGPVRLVAEGNWNQLFPGAAVAANYDFDLSLHSMAPLADGTRTYLAYLRGGLGVLNTSMVANNQVPAGTVESLNDDLLTPVPFPTWGTGPQCAGHTAAGCAESHSAVPLPGTPFALTIDEVYGTFTVSSFGWPWGWARVWNVAQPARPRIVGEYKIFQNTEGFRADVDPATEQFTSYSSHNPTLTRKIAFDSWHSGGLQAIDLSNPAQPKQAGFFSPAPLDAVATEDPALSRGPNKVVIWSYPIIKDGLIYVVDIRNGLYILRYTGPHARGVNDIRFLEGNSNLGDAVALDQSAGNDE